MAITVKNVHDNGDFFNVELDIDGTQIEFTADKTNQIWEPASGCDCGWSEIENLPTVVGLGYDFELYLTNMLSRAVGFIDDVE